MRHRPCEHVVDGLRIEPMFLDEDARGQRLYRIVGKNGDRGLPDDRAGVEIRCHEMDGGAGDLRRRARAPAAARRRRERPAGATGAR